MCGVAHRLSVLPSSCGACATGRSRAEQNGTSAEPRAAERCFAGEAGGGGCCCIAPSLYRPWLPTRAGDNGEAKAAKQRAVEGGFECFLASDASAVVEHTKK